MANRVVLVVLCCLWLAGCAPANREKLSKEVLERDPEFGQVLEKHRELSNRIDIYQRELALKRATVEQAIAKQRKDLSAAVASVRAKTADVKKRMEPDRQRLMLALSMAGEELRAKQGQRASLGRSLAQLRKAAKNDGVSWTTEERAGHDAQMQDILHDADRLDQEIAALKEHLRLLNVKLLLIKL